HHIRGYHLRTGSRWMTLRLLMATLVSLSCSAAAGPQLSALVIDGVNNHDWAAGTRGIQSILEGSGRFTVTVCTWPAKPDFGHYDVVITNFNGGHTAEGTRWPRGVEQALETYVRGGGGLVGFHAAHNAFLNWPEDNDMIRLGHRQRPRRRGGSRPEGRRSESGTRPAPRFRGVRARRRAPHHAWPARPLGPSLRAVDARPTRSRAGPRHPDLRLLRSLAPGRAHGLGAAIRPRAGLHHHAGTHLAGRIEPQSGRCVLPGAVGAWRRVGGHRAGHAARRPGLAPAVRRQDAGGLGTARRRHLERPPRWQPARPADTGHGPGGPPAI